jgi:excisionase family DNA binding protein
MPKPKNPLPTLREKLASFDGAIGADDIARLLQTSRHTIYLWVRDNRIPHFRLNGSLKFDPALIADWIDSTSSTQKKASTVREDEARIIPVLQVEDARAICAVAAVVNVTFMLPWPCPRNHTGSAPTSEIFA